MKAYRITKNDVGVGDPLPWNVIDREGKLLLKKGAIVTSTRVHELLLERGLYQKQTLDQAKTATIKPEDQPKGPFNPFEIIENCTFKLGRTLYNLTQNKDCSENLNLITKSIMMACAKDPDAALGAVHLLHGHAYTTIHPIHVAALCHALCRVTNLSDEETHRIISACLVSNIGMLELQEVLHDQEAPLSQEQKDQIAAHPEESVKILRANGIKDEAMLEIVLQHHERAHGEGYPNKLKGEEINIGAKILALADCYSAMVSPRIYRDTVDTSAALKTLFLERGKEYDEQLAIQLIKYMGIFPPGTYVKLANGEIGLVVRRTANNMAPQVSSVISIKQLPYSRPIKRDNKRKEFAIKGIVENKKKFSFSLATIWGYETA